MLNGKGGGLISFGTNGCPCTVNCAEVGGSEG